MILAKIGVGYLLLVCLLYGFQKHLIFFPSTQWGETPESIGLAYESISSTTADGETISSWYIPHPNAIATVLVCHGNAGNISHRLSTIEQFHKLRLSVVIFDYRGYGKSTGSPSEKGVYEDARTVLAHVKKQYLAPREKIIYFGRSLGGAIAAWLASQDPPDALILEATFTSAIDVARANPILRWIPTTLILRHQFQTVTYAKDLTMPTLVIHSTQDETIPYKLGKKLYDTLNGPKQFLTIKGTHNDGFLVSNVIYSKTLDAFITSLKDES